MKEFTTALKAVTEDDDDAPLMFSIDGHEMRAYRPSDGQLAMLMVAISKHASDQARIAGVIDFFVSIMDKESHSYVVDRLLSREDPLGIEEVKDVIEWMVEEWTGRPTQPLSVSTQ
jgi:hypothetical protein